MKKLFLLIGLSITVLLLAYYFLSSNFANKIKDVEYLKKIIPPIMCDKLLPHNYCQKTYDNYNVKYLPDTQFAKINLTNKKFREEETYLKFFIELFEDNLLIIDGNGKIKRINVNDIKIDKKVKLESKTVKTNIDVTGLILDTLIYNNNIYISYSSKIEDCNKLNISFAKLNTKLLDFQNFFTAKECKTHEMGDMNGGRMQYFKYKNSEGLLVTTAMDKKETLDSFGSNKKAQDHNSIFGKILFIDFITSDYIVFSKGHRNPQGLFAENNLILSTEHGPRGGDEINNIIYNKNYGWPISSYGEKYLDYSKTNYIKNHAIFGFEEPIFSFVPSIGISEIIKIPNEFSNKWLDNFLISSLNDRSLYRIKFDKNYQKILFNEKILIGQRIRDLKYHHGMNIILLALEDKGEIGILKYKNN